MKIRPITAFFPEGKRAADNLLITSSSFEKRCLGFVSYLRKNAPEYRADAVLLIRYSERGDAAIAARARRWSGELVSLLQSVSNDGHVEHQFLDPYALIEAWQFFSAVFREIPNGSSVVVDISTMTKLHVMYLLEAARKSPRVDSLRLVYTRAQYGRYDTLSWGAEDPVVVPAFGRPRRTDRQSERLILFCGLEPDRCYSIWRRFGQSNTIKVFIDSGDQDIDRCADRAMRLNYYGAKATVVTQPAFRPDLITQFLHAQYKAALSAGDYLYIAPMTTKWEIIAVCDFFAEIGIDEADAAILYSAPGRLNASGHTRDELGECLFAPLRLSTGR